MSRILHVLLYLFAFKVLSLSREQHQLLIHDTRHPNWHMHTVLGMCVLKIIQIILF